VPKEPGALRVDDANLAPALWFNLDGRSALVTLKVGVWVNGGNLSVRVESRRELGYLFCWR